MGYDTDVVHQGLAKSVSKRVSEPSREEISTYEEVDKQDRGLLRRIQCLLATGYVVHMSATFMTALLMESLAIAPH
jgi:hypothetical protein